MENETESIVDISTMTNKELNELSEQCKIAYEAAQRIVTEQYDIMERAAELYKRVTELLEKRQGKRKKKDNTPTKK